jgi:hypothetical protein
MQILLKIFTQGMYWFPQGLLDRDGFHCSKDDGDII